VDYDNLLEEIRLRLIRKEQREDFTVLREDIKAHGQAIAKNTQRLDDHNHFHKRGYQVTGLLLTLAGVIATFVHILGG